MEISEGILVFCTLLSGIVAITTMVQQAIAVFNWIHLVALQKQAIEKPKQSLFSKIATIASMVVIVMIICLTLVEVIDNKPITRYSIVMISFGVSISICYILFFYMKIQFTRISHRITRAHGTAIKGLKLAKRNL